VNNAGAMEKRPLYIAIEGPIGVGKSTLVQRLRERGRRTRRRKGCGERWLWTNGRPGRWRWRSSKDKRCGASKVEAKLAR
jgi:hypothetical protein